MMSVLSFYLFFFFSSRRRHTRLQGDWSSDVCSSDLKGRVSRVLPGMQAAFVEIGLERTAFLHAADIAAAVSDDTGVSAPLRSEERRVGKECRSRWSPYH